MKATKTITFSTGRISPRSYRKKLIKSILGVVTNKALKNKGKPMDADDLENCTFLMDFVKRLE